jgi:arylsulfatase A-like enzyme
LIVRWPGKIKPGTTSDRLTAAYDYMTTFVDLLDQQQLHNKDGVSFLPTLLGKHKQEREYVIVKDAIISGRWKLVNMKKTNYLFDLSNDPGERNNVAGAHPERVNQLFKTLNADRNKK